MIDSWNSAVLNDLIRKQKNIPALLDQVESNEWNLLRLPYYRVSGYENRKVVYTIDESGNVTANGTATGGDSSINLKTLSMNFLPGKGKVYRVGGCPADGSTATYYVRYAAHNSSSSVISQANDVGEGGYLYIPEEATGVSVIIYIRSGVTATNLKFTPYFKVMDVPACSEATAGNYFLQATVDSDGAITYSWEEVAP